MPFPRKLLNDGEELVLDLRPHWWFLAPSVAALVVAIALGVVALAVDLSGTPQTVVRILAGLLVLVAVVFFIARYLVWTTTNFVLTSDRVVSRRGVLSKQGIEIPLERINTVFFHQGVLERMIGAGDLTIESAGERGSEPFTDIRRPAEVQREIYVQMERNDNRKYDRINSNITSHLGGGGGGLSTAEQLEKLHDLYQQGALTSDQYEAEKAKVLGR